MDKITYTSKEGMKEITVPEYGSVHFTIQDGKIYKVEVTESTIIKKDK